MSRTAQVLGLQAQQPGSEGGETILAFTLILIIGALILLVGWMNVSALMVAAAVARRHEIAVRLSLGASRPRLLRQMVTESTLLALTGGALGLLMSWWFLTWKERTAVDGVSIAPDLGTFAFVLAMAVITGVLFGLSPALHATRGGVASALRDSGGGAGKKSRLQRTFVVAQIALSQPLLVLLGTMLSLVIADYQPQSAEMSRRVIAAGFRPLERGAPGQRPVDVDSLIPRIAGLPGVVNAVPEASGFAIRGIVVPGRPTRAQGDSTSTVVHVEGAAPGWFAVVDIRIILGRDVALADTAAADHRVVIGTDLARSLFGGANPVGRTLASPPLPGLGQDSITLTVIGVYDESRSSVRMTWNGGAARGTVLPRMYTAHGKQWQHDRILVRTQGPAAPYVPSSSGSCAPRHRRCRSPGCSHSSRKIRRSTRTRSRRQHWPAPAARWRCCSLAGTVRRGVALGAPAHPGDRHPHRAGRLPDARGADVPRLRMRASLVALAIGLPLSVVAMKIGMAQGVFIAPDVNPYVVGGAIALILLGVAAIATWVPARRAALVNPARTLSAE